MKHAVIAGASGLVGSHALRLLLESPSFEAVTSLVRAPTGKSHRKLTERVVNFGQLADLTLGSTVNSVFCCLGTTIGKAGSQRAFREVDFEFVVALARLGLRHQARHFLVVSSLGADSRSRIFYNRTKGEMEDAVGALGYPTLDVFRPSLLLGTRREVRSGERVGEAVLGLLRPVLVGPLRDYRAIEAETVARAMIARAESPEPGHHTLSSASIAGMAAP